MVAENVDVYRRVGGDCVVFRSVAIMPEIFMACGKGPAIRVLKEEGGKEWRLGNVGIEHDVGVRASNGAISAKSIVMTYSSAEAVARGGGKRSVVSDVIEGTLVTSGIDVEVVESAVPKKLLEQKDKNGRTLLMTACVEGDAPAVEALVRAGANVNAEDGNKNTPLILGAGNAEIVRVLLAAGASGTAEDLSGWTPLGVAASEGAVEVIRLLLAGGADPAYRNRFGKTARDYCRGPNRDVVKDMLSGVGPRSHGSGSR
jgi:hypothetical protein